MSDVDDDADAAWTAWLAREGHRYGEPNERERALAERAFKAAWRYAFRLNERDRVRVTKENLDLIIALRASRPEVRRRLNAHPEFTPDGHDGGIKASADIEPGAMVTIDDAGNVRPCKSTDPLLGIASERIAKGQAVVIAGGRVRRLRSNPL
jgi:hypothetical protein